MMEVRFNPFPVLETDRLHLKQVGQQDVTDVFALRSDPNIMKYILRPLAVTEADASAHIEKITQGIESGESINWGIYLKTNQRLIGILGFVRMARDSYRAEIGYLLHTDFHRQGIMREAITPVIDFGFRVMKIHRMEAIVHPDNIPSYRLLENNGFQREGLLRRYIFHKEKFNDALIYSRISPLT